MIDGKKQNELESLSRAWSERVKGIRQKAKTGDTADSPTALIGSESRNPSIALPPDNELFAGKVEEHYAIEDIFSGDEAFYQSISHAAPVEPVHDDLFVTAPPSLPRRQKKTSPLTKILIGCLALGAILMAAWNFLDFSRFLNPQKTDAIKSAEAVNTEVSVVVDDTDAAELSLSPDHPASLKIARDYFQQGELRRAAAIYRRLLQNLPETTDDVPVRDFLELNIALCMQKTNVHQSVELLKKASASHSPIIRILANYHLCLLEIQRKQFLAARTSAYRAIALLDAIELDEAWSASVKRNCYFLAAETVTREALALADADQELPTALWPVFETIEFPFFANATQQDLQNYLNTGAKFLDQALLNPKIQVEMFDDINYWTIACNGASIDELLNRFSVNSGCDIRWSRDLSGTSPRDRSVKLYLAAANDRHFITVSAGCAGLLASYGADQTVTVCNPFDYTTASEQLALLTEEAVLCWQKYLLAFFEDEYGPNAHFSLGLLKEQMNLTAEALAEYKMVPARFTNSALGPAALLHSAKLKSTLQDFNGAYDDLKEAVEQYPDHENISTTYLRLADAAQKMNRRDEAAKLYSKIFYLNDSPESQEAAALSAGKVFYHNGDYNQAQIWLTRYINLARNEHDQNFYEGCLYMGRTWMAMGSHASACEALRVSLQGRLSQKDYVETVTALVQGYIRQEKLVEALDILGKTSSRQLSQENAVQMLLLRSKVLREMGLTHKAVLLLIDREEYIIDDMLKSQIGYELSECYIEQDQLPLAHKKLARILESAPPGPFAHQTAFRLAQVCMELEMDDQALNVASRLLAMNPSESTRQNTMKLLASVYEKHKDYDRAAAVLMGQWQ